MRLRSRAPRFCRKSIKAEYVRSDPGRPGKGRLAGPRHIDGDVGNAVRKEASTVVGAGVLPLVDTTNVDDDRRPGYIKRLLQIGDDGLAFEGDLQDLDLGGEQFSVGNERGFRLVGGFLLARRVGRGPAAEGIIEPSLIIVLARSIRTLRSLGLRPGAIAIADRHEGVSPPVAIQDVDM